MEVPARRVRFGAFEVDLHSGELRKHGLKIKLQDQPFQVLALLLERPGEMVSREELRQKLWPANTFVDFDVGLNTAIKRLREALGDSADNPRFVETVPRRGYRFIASVEDVTPMVAPTALPSNGAPPVPKPEAAITKSAEDIPAVAKAGLRPRSVLGIALAAAAGLALLLTWSLPSLRQRVHEKTIPPKIQSIAVLPLENLSGDPAQEYFADGITEALITDLGKIGALRVISRTSAMHYKGTRKTLPEIARELNVDAVVEGAVRRSGNRVRITTQLVAAASDRRLWAESYERDLRDVLALQDEVARAVANEIRIKLTLQEQARLTTGRPVDPEAHEAYLKGRYEWNKWTEQGFEKSIEYFEQAVQKDSAYAQAWAGLADAYQFLGLFGFWPSQVASPKAKAAALKALELDATLSDAHVSLAGVMWLQESSWSAAENELQRAIALNPNNAWAHQAHGYVLSSAARFEEAIAEMKRAQELDPLSSNKQHSLAATLYRAGRYDEALQQFREVPDPDANSEGRHRFMAAIYERKGIQKEAIAELLTAMRFAGERDLAGRVEQKYVSSGYSEAKKTFLRGDVREQQKRARGVARIHWVAIDYALLGEKDKALEWLDKTFREEKTALIYLKVDDSFEPLRSDPRFQDLLRRMGLPP